MLRVPRIEFPDYPSYERLRTVSRDELISAFCERPTAWDERLFTPCRPFAKRLRFMNMVMTFVLHPLSHYNSITEPRAQFLLSLLEHLTIDFPSDFILSVWANFALCSNYVRGRARPNIPCERRLTFEDI